MVFIESNPDRKQAYDLGVPPATSDWIAAWCQQNAIQLTPEQAESLTESFSLHHQWVARESRAEFFTAIADVPPDRRMEWRNARRIKRLRTANG